MKFTKIEGAGNDFLIMESIENIDIKRICDRHYGVGADGIILIENIKEDLVEARIFNADGSEANTCGNGLRCLGAYLKQKLNKECFNIKTLSQTHIVQSLGKEVKVFFKKGIVIENDENVYLVDTGNKHLFKFVDELKKEDFESFVSFIRKKNNYNVEHVKIIDGNNIEMIINEAGVGETLACGSACVAVASALCEKGIMNNEVQFFLKGGVIVVNIEKDYISLKGKVSVICEGEYYV